MARLRRTTAAGCAALLLATAATGCSGTPEPADATPQALAAAVQAHHDDDAIAVAPVFGDERLRRDDLVVDVTFDRTEGDNTHVRVVLSDRPPFGRAEGRLCNGPWRCLEADRDGVDGTLMYEAGYPEEDPGVVFAWSIREDVVVWAHAHGPFVVPNDEGGPGAEAEELGETLVAVVTDPGVGWRTSGEYVEGGQEICEGDSWRRWYGEGNGTPEPEDWRDWCA